MKLRDYLGRHGEDVPDWLAGFVEADSFSLKALLSSRVVFYPGSGGDGHPVELFASTHSAHTFIYVDYGRTQQDIEQELDSPERGFRGYHTLARRQLGESDLLGRGWTSHLPFQDVPERRPSSGPEAYGLLEILERDNDLDEAHGASRLAILFLGADGIATYDALFCQESIAPAPFAVILQDHGFGGNYDRFGAGGLLEKLALRCRVIPDLLLVADGTQAWEAYKRVAGVEGEPGGQHATMRYLHVPIRRHR